MQACKYSLRQIAPLLESETMSTMFQKLLQEDSHIHYTEFINDLTKTLVRYERIEIVNFLSYLLGICSFL